MAVIQGNALLIYFNGEPIGATTSASLKGVPAEPCTTVTTGEYTFTASKFEMPELTPRQEWNYQWYRSGDLPRKAKKAYRKKLLKMLQ